MWDRERGGRRAPLTRCGSPSGGRRDGTKAHLRPQHCSGRAIPEACRGVGRRAPAVGFAGPDVQLGVRTAWFVTTVVAGAVAVGCRPHSKRSEVWWFGSCRTQTCGLAITRSHYRLVPDGHGHLP
jgi:hypothetical protein